MIVNLDIHIKKDDPIAASIVKAEESGEFVVLQVDKSATIYFEDYGFEGYKNACRILDRMKNAIQEVWRERKGGSNGNERSSEA